VSGPLYLEAAEQTRAVGRRLAEALRAAGIEEAVVHLIGDLGAGKTTFARGFLEGLGHAGRVPSPTYTLVEPYEFDTFTVYHVDLYRLDDPSEVEDLGLLDLIGPGGVMLIEWPEHAGGRLPGPDLRLTLAIEGDGRTLDIEALTARGRLLDAEKMWYKDL